MFDFKKSEQRNLFVAVFLSIAIMVGFHFLYESPKQQKIQSEAQKEHVEKKEVESPLPVEKQPPLCSRQEALEMDPRVPIAAKKVRGSIRMKGGCLDDLVLNAYKESTDPKSGQVVLLSPEESKDGYLIHFGWNGSDVPDESTQWSVDRVKEDSGDALELNELTPLRLFYENRKGIRFERTFKVDDKYLITVTDRVINETQEDITLHPFSEIRRYNTPITSGFYILHEGIIGVLQDKLKEIDYKDFDKTSVVESTTKGGWAGFTDKYWLVSLIAPNAESAKSLFSKKQQGTRELYRTSFTYELKTVKANKSIEFTHTAFVGAKVLSTLEFYEKSNAIPRFDLAVDFGWFYFITKPLFYTLDHFQGVLGNFGLAILLLTVLVKLLAFPLAYKTNRSMGRMKLLQPELEKLKKIHGDDKVRLNQEIMALYQKEKVNPMSGCLPMLIQAPLFFCLYKVFFVTIEMRHAPFWGWIQDLSAPDPTSLFNLFGLLPFTPPSFLMIGIWPLIMGATMVFQQRMSPQPQDPAQAKAMMILPLVFTFMFASFPAGLVIYWAWSNLLTVLQQVTMARFVPETLSTPKPANRSKKGH